MKNLWPHAGDFPLFGNPIPYLETSIFQNIDYHYFTLWYACCLLKGVLK